MAIAVAGRNGHSTGRARVLLAEDHPSMAAELSALLATEYDVVDVVRDGQALINSNRTLRPDVIVSDIGMPVVSGLAAADALLTGDPDCRVVLVTVIANRDVILKARDMGVLGYVLKCDGGDELLRAVGAALRGIPFLSSSVGGVLDESPDPGSSDSRRY